MEGCAYRLVGVEPSTPTGVSRLDQAKLEAGVNVYAGSKVEWRSDYVELDGKTVLVVTVEAPRWGDHIRSFQKAYNPADKPKEEGSTTTRRSAGVRSDPLDRS
jgi:hypothetical protein